MGRTTCQSVLGQLAPRLSDHRSRIAQNEALFQRIGAVAGSPELAERAPAEQRILAQVAEDELDSMATVS